MFVATDFTTPIRSASTYAGVVSRYTVKITFTYASLNVLDIMLYEI